LRFALESDNRAAHSLTVRLSGLASGTYVLRVGDGPDVIFEMSKQQSESSAEKVVEAPIPAGAQRQAVTIKRVTDPAVNTFSIVGFDPATGDLGIAVASKVLGVGSIVPYAKANVGAIATQSAANTAYGPDGLALLAAGKDARETVQLLTEADMGRDDRQLGIVDGRGNVAAFSGSKCNAWYGHIEGDHFTVQGNLLTGEDVVKKMAAAFEEARKIEGSELADWLMAALKSGDAAGGDKRGRQSAAIMVVRDKAGYGNNDRYIDLRVEDHTEPIVELSRLLDVHKEYFSWPHRHPPRREKTDSPDNENDRDKK
jgi:uncharacterized Ntn-hydrolase superfamily protein